MHRRRKTDQPKPYDVEQSLPIGGSPQLFFSAAANREARSPLIRTLQGWSGESARITLDDPANKDVNEVDLHDDVCATISAQVKAWCGNLIDCGLAADRANDSTYSQCKAEIAKLNHDAAEALRPKRKRTRTFTNYGGFAAIEAPEDNFFDAANRPFLDILRDLELEPAFQTLPFDQRMAFVLHQYEHYTYEELANMTGESKSTWQRRNAAAWQHLWECRHHGDY